MAAKGNMDVVLNIQLKASISMVLSLRKVLNISTNLAVIVFIFLVLNTSDV